MSEHLCGVYRGLCTDARDPETRGRVKVKVPALMGDTELADWAEPCWPPGWGSKTSPVKDHVFTDNDTGVGAGGNATETLKHELRQKTPLPGDLVWVLFEEGDVDRPVWMGVAG